MAKLLYVAECDCCLTAEVKSVNSAYACKRECKFQNACGKTKYSTSRALLDSVVWSYVKENAELIEQEQIRNRNTESIAKLENEIINIEAKIAEKEKEQSKENDLFRIDAISLAELENRLVSIKKDISSFRSAIKNKQEEIESIKDFLSNSLSESVADMISSAEGNPSEMKKYVNRFIKKIVVHLSDRNYSILEVIPKKYMGATKAQSFVVPVVDEDEDGNIIEGGYRIINTEEMHYEVNDNDYIIIDKKRKLAFAIDNTIQAHSVAYNRDEDVFIYANNNDWDVLLNIEQLIIFYQISRLSNDNAPKLSEQGFNIIFKTLKYL